MQASCMVLLTSMSPRQMPRTCLNTWSHLTFQSLGPQASTRITVTVVTPQKTKYTENLLLLHSSWSSYFMKLKETLHLRAGQMFTRYLCVNSAEANPSCESAVVHNSIERLLTSFMREEWDAGPRTSSSILDQILQEGITEI